MDKEAVARRIAPMLEMMIIAKTLDHEITKLSLDVGKMEGVTPEALYNRLLDAKEAFESGWNKRVGSVLTTLALEASKDKALTGYARDTLLDVWQRRRHGARRLGRRSV